MAAVSSFSVFFPPWQHPKGPCPRQNQSMLYKPPVLRSWGNLHFTG